MNKKLRALGVVLPQFHPIPENDEWWGKGFSEEENFVFLNAMNEWAEGNHLEPDLKWGLKYLKATKIVLEKSV